MKISYRFLNVLRQREDIFSIDSLSLIFANIEQIWQFQQTFLDALRNGIQQNRIAETFIEFVSLQLKNFFGIFNFKFHFNFIFNSNQRLWSTRSIAIHIQEL